MARTNPANLLKDALQGTGFVRRGSAFFRVWGDGVLQVLKFDYQWNYTVHDLSVGVFSMYGRLDPEWFTSGGCIPRGSIANFVGLRWPEDFLSLNRLTKTDDGQFLYDGFPVTVDPTQRLGGLNGGRWHIFFTPEQQIPILVEKALPWLNEITNQSLAAKAMYKIDPVPNDALRFDAHLAAGEWSEAEQTMSAILKQHADAKESWKQHLPPDQYAEMVAKWEVWDAPLKAAYKMVQEKDEAAISAYLADNYKRNCELAKFCMK